MYTTRPTPWWPLVGQRTFLVTLYFPWLRWLWIWLHTGVIGKLEPACYISYKSHIAYGFSSAYSPSLWNVSPSFCFHSSLFCLFCLKGCVCVCEWKLFLDLELLPLTFVFADGLFYFVIFFCKSNSSKNMCMTASQIAAVIHFLTRNQQRNIQCCLLWRMKRPFFKLDDKVGHHVEMPFAFVSLWCSILSPLQMHLLLSQHSRMLKWSLNGMKGLRLCYIKVAFKRHRRLYISYFAVWYFIVFLLWHHVS